MSKLFQIRAEGDIVAYVPGDDEVTAMSNFHAGRIFAHGIDLHDTTAREDVRCVSDTLDADTLLEMLPEPLKNYTPPNPEPIWVRLEMRVNGVVQKSCKVKATRLNTISEVWVMSRPVFRRRSTSASATPDFQLLYGDIPVRGDATLNDLFKVLGEDDNPVFTLNG